ncbi:MAG: PQQ-like beta-propeller repeat protein [Acidobacteria bacterium]|nr:PQQ-like beta-propeller repeat protein [Acidobacteriota bacterium]
MVRTIIPIVFLLSSVAITNAQDWTQWRGPNRDGGVTNFAAPAIWPEKLKLVWKTPVGGGYSSPIVFKNKAWVFSRQEEKEVISCLDLKSGKILWSQSYGVPFKKNQYATEMGQGPHSTPVLYQDKLFTLGVNAVLSCFDANTGALKWRKDFGIPNTSKMFCGTAMSPVIENGNVIVHIGDDIKGGLMIAFEATTGKEAWKLDCDGPGYASPIVMTVEGTRQLVTMTDKSVLGVDVQKGTQLWKLAWPDEWNENIVTPTLYKNTLILSGVRKGTMAVQVAKTGAEWTTNQVWHNPELTLYMNSPVLDGDFFYGMSAKRKGQFFCAEAATGKVRWATEGREGSQASLLNAKDALFILTSDANLIVAKKVADKFQQLAKYSVADSATYAHPILFGKRILIKDNATLALWSVE